MTFNGHFALNSVLLRDVWSSEARLSKLGYSYKKAVLSQENRAMPQLFFSV